jgi:hypothetical protein
VFLGLDASKFRSGTARTRGDCGDQGLHQIGYLNLKVLVNAVLVPLNVQIPDRRLTGAQMLRRHQ